jgi:hypothetical protein
VLEDQAGHRSRIFFMCQMPQPRQGADRAVAHQGLRPIGNHSYLVSHGRFANQSRFTSHINDGHNRISTTVMTWSETCCRVVLGRPRLLAALSD